MASKNGHRVDSINIDTWALEWFIFEFSLSFLESITSSDFKFIITEFTPLVTNSIFSFSLESIISSILWDESDFFNVYSWEEFLRTVIVVVVLVAVVSAGVGCEYLFTFYFLLFNLSGSLSSDRFGYRYNFFVLFGLFVFFKFFVFFLLIFQLKLLFGVKITGINGSFCLLILLFLFLLLNSLFLFFNLYLFRCLFLLLLNFAWLFGLISLLNFHNWLNFLF